MIPKAKSNMANGRVLLCGRPHCRSPWGRLCRISLVFSCSPMSWPRSKFRRREWLCLREGNTSWTLRTVRSTASSCVSLAEIPMNFCLVSIHLLRRHGHRARPLVPPIQATYVATCSFLEPTWRPYCHACNSGFPLDQSHSTGSTWETFWRLMPATAASNSHSFLSFWSL